MHQIEDSKQQQALQDRCNLNRGRGLLGHKVFQTVQLLSRILMNIRLTMGKTMAMKQLNLNLI